MTELIPISDVQIPQGREPRRNVRILAESIEKIGLLNPITVRAIQLFEAGAEPRTGYRLVAGRNRLEAMKQLDHDEIPATIVSLEDLECQLAEIDENLIRSDISVVDQGDRFDDRQRIWEAIYDDTKHGGDRKSPKYKEKNQDEIISSWSEHAADALGVTPRSVQHLTKVGRLPDDIKDLVRGTALGDHLVNLLKLARITDRKEQRAAALAYISGEADTITVPKKRAPTKNERQQAAQELAEILIEYVPADLWPQVCTYLTLDKATVTLSAFRKLQKATVTPK